jgi:phospholipid/cholesterol/gamma-HCH transport system substrate-binding protein
LATATPPEENAPERSLAVRVAALAAVLAAAALVGIALLGNGDSYSVTARFINAGQIVKGNPVQSGGVPIGSVSDIEITDDGQAEVKLEIDERNAPLRVGTRAAIRQLSQSGIANRYVDLTIPPHGSEEIPDGGEIGIEKTRTAVDLDQLFNTLDSKTRKALQGFFKGQAAQFRRRGRQANRGFQYLNPALATSSRLFGELTRDTPLLEHFLVDSSKLVTALAERRDDLAVLIGDLNATTRALGSQKTALAESIERLPPFMRRANTTFVNLRAALDDVDPLVDASRPVARKLGPVLAEARALTAGARPTVRDLSRLIRRRGRSNDLVEYVRSVPPLADIALASKRRTAAPGGREVDVGTTRGAFPETVEALRGGTPELAFARPYTTDFLGWFDDFNQTGIGHDALGNIARAHISFSENLPLPPGLGPVRQGQYRRCPGSAEAPAADGSNVLSEEERRRLNCDESARATGDVQ